MSAPPDSSDGANVASSGDEQTTAHDRPSKQHDATTATVRPGDARPRAKHGTRPESQLTTGTLVGRYVVLELLGAGGMGVVYAAYDPELDRRVAIKLIGTERDKQPGSQARDRLLREAQALAQLSHPNVVAIYDVGTFARSVFIAMELVRGVSLRELLDRSPPAPVAERRRIVIAAGRGLAAAHRAGLVHRDVKPANILVADDGSVRVADFGLARAALDGDSGIPAHISDDAEVSSPRVEGRLRSPLTEQGSLVGTPQYMAPEVLDGGPAGELSDQFSFCITAFETFYGVRPFVGSGLKALREAIKNGEPQIPDGAKVPARVRGILLRGLAKDPSARYPSMDALLEELAAEPVFTPARVAAVTLLVIALGATGVVASHRSSKSEPCAAAGDGLAGVWNENRRTVMRTAFAASGARYAATTSERVGAILDDYGAAWTRMRIESCRATRVDGTQSEHLLDLRTACLDRRRLQLGALVDVFSSGADEAMVRKATSAAAALPPITTCADVAALTAAVPPPETPQVAAGVAALRARIDHAAALLRAGRYDRASALAIPLASESDRLDYQATRAEVRRLLGEARLRAGDSKGAEPDLLEAIRAAARAHDDHLVVEGWALLIFALGQQGRYQDALLLRTSAEAAVDRAGGDPLLRSLVLGNIGAVLNQLERFPESEKVFTEAIALREHAGAPEVPELASLLLGMANSLGEQGRHREARAYYDRAIAVWEHTLGADHPQLGIPLNNLGNSLADQGEYAEAERYYKRAIEVWERALGPNFPNLAYPHNGLGGLMLEQHRYDEAWPHFEHAYALWKAQLGDDHPDVGMVLSNLGEVRFGQHRYTEALEYYRRALAITERAFGSNHMGITFALTGIGACQLALGHPAEALTVLERSWKIRSSAASSPMELSSTEFALARAVYAAGDRRRARALATEARDRFSSDKPDWAISRTEIDTWLATH